MSAVDFYIDTVCENIDNFDCRFDVFNNYLKDSGDCAVLHYIINADNEDLIAYFSLLSAALLFGAPDRMHSIPAIEIKMFAIDKKYQKLGIAPTLINAALSAIQSYSTEYIGAEVVILYSVNVSYIFDLYKERGFQPIEGMFLSYKNIFNDGCIPMFKLIN